MISYFYENYKYNHIFTLIFYSFFAKIFDSEIKGGKIMQPGQIILLVVLVILIGATVALYFMGKKAQKKKDEQDAQMAAVAQTVSMLIIDKKKLRIKDSGLPQAVIDQTPKYMRWSKLPVVKAKVGPKIMTLIADESIFAEIPLKKEVKATVSGIYITGIRGLRGPLEKPSEKKSWRAKLKDKYNSLNAELQAEKEAESTKKSKKKK